MFILFVSFFYYIYLFVICLFSMLIYSHTKLPQSLLIVFQIELFNFILFFSYRDNIAEKKKYRNVKLFSNILQP